MSAMAQQGCAEAGLLDAGCIGEDTSSMLKILFLGVAAEWPAGESSIPKSKDGGAPPISRMDFIFLAGVTSGSETCLLMFIDELFGGS